MDLLFRKAVSHKRRRRAEGEAACGCRVRSWRSCLRSRHSAGLGAGCLVGSGETRGRMCGTASPTLHSSSTADAISGSLRHQAPYTQPAKRRGISWVLTALVTLREVLRPTQDWATHIPPRWHLACQQLTLAANSNVSFLFHGWTHSSRLDPANSFPIFHGFYILVKCLK